MTSAYQASAHVTFVDVPSAKADHTPKPRTHVERGLHRVGTPAVTMGWHHLYNSLSQM